MVSLFLNVLSNIFNPDENPLGFTIAIVSICLIGLLLIFLMVFPIAKRHYTFKNFQNIYYKAIRKIADINDYYLINNLDLLLI